MTPGGGTNHSGRGPPLRSMTKKKKKKKKGIKFVLDRNYYDLILIAPQVSYTYLKLKEKFGHKVMKIDTMDYASCNIKNVIHNLVS